jgi:Rieske Fe-S protein
MNKISRRDFLKIFKWLLTVTGLAAVLGPIIAYFYPPKLEEMPSEPVPAGTLADLRVNESVTIRFGRYPALVMHTPEGLRAYSAVCTHFACIVKWDPDAGRIACPCHDGYFDPLDGHVTGGPPPTPLEPLKVEVVDGQIMVGGTA